MDVMQSLQSEQQTLAAGIFNTIFRLGTAIVFDMRTGVFFFFPKAERRLRTPWNPT